MTTDNRTNEPTHEQVEAAAKALYEFETGLAEDSWGRAFEVERSLWRDEARAALVAAQGAAPQAGRECTMYCFDLPKPEHHDGCDALAAPVLPSSTVDEQSIRDSIARDIWNDEQECNAALRKAEVGSSTAIELGGKLTGLQRARDISQGVLVRDLDEAKLARMIDRALLRHTEMAGLSNEERWEMRDDVAVSVTAYLRGES